MESEKTSTDAVVDGLPSNSGDGSKAPDPNRVTCDTCRFWQMISSDLDYGACHRYPPIILPMTLAQLAHGDEDDDRFSVWDASQWPETDGESWCGEHQPVYPKN